jgi:uncharacterized protein involved in exopolysaccharide biosynthesis
MSQDVSPARPPVAARVRRPADGGPVTVPGPATPDKPASGRDRRELWRSILTGALIAAVLVGPAAGALAWSYTQPTTYAAEVDLLFQMAPESSVDNIDRDLATHQVLLLRRPLLDDIAEQVGRDPQALADNTGVDVVEQSNVLRLRVVDTDVDRARRTADLLADEYAATTDDLAASSDIGQVQPISPATVLDRPVGPQPLRAAAGGAVVGLALVMALLAVLRLRRPRSRPPAP